MVWYSYLLKNFPQFVVIYTVKGFSAVNEAEVDVFLEFFSFFYDPLNFLSSLFVLLYSEQWKNTETDLAPERLQVKTATVPTEVPWG